MHLNEKQRRAALIFGVTAAVYGSFRYLFPLFVPFLAAYLTALLLRPSAVFLEQRLTLRLFGKRRKLPLGFIGGTELLMFLLILGTVLIYGGRRLILEAGQLAEELPVLIETFDCRLTALCHLLERFFSLREGTFVLTVREMLREMLEALRAQAGPGILKNSVELFRLGAQGTVLLVLWFFASALSLEEMDEMRRRRRRSIFRREFALLGRRMALTGSVWLRTQLVIFLLTSALCSAVLFLMGNGCAVLCGIGIGFMDLLPVLGTGTVLVPWGLLLLSGKKWVRGFLVLGLYAACYFLREWMETKLMGKQVGLSPLQTLVSVYAGVRLFGAPGLLLGPIGLLLIEDLVEEYDRKQGFR